MRGFKITPDYDIDLSTLCEDDPEVVTGAITVTARTWRTEWPGNLRTGIDGGLIGLRATPEEISQTLAAELIDALIHPPLPGFLHDNTQASKVNGRQYRALTTGFEIDPLDPNGPKVPLTVENLIGL